MFPGTLRWVDTGQGPGFSTGFIQPECQIPPLGRISPFLAAAQREGERETGVRESGGESWVCKGSRNPLGASPLSAFGPGFSPPPAPLFILRQSGWKVGTS